jgi:DNA-binding MarR family transcriptional regulator
MGVAVKERFQHESKIFGMIFFLTQQLARTTDSTMLPLGITAKQWLLLAVLSRHFRGQAPMLSEVALIYGSSRQNAKMIAKQLEASGYLKIKQDPDDRRALRLQLTPKMKIFDSP